MNSPIDGTQMLAIEYEGAMIYTCPTSGGELIGPDALSHIIRTRRTVAGAERRGRGAHRHGTGTERLQRQPQPGELVGPREQRFGPEWQALVDDHAPLRGVPGDASERQLACPFCDGVMRPVNYGSDTAVIVDRCEGCGAVWLDAHELEMIQALMETWQDHAPEAIRRIARDLEEARSTAAARADDAFRASRFSFVNAVMNRLLDAA